MQMERCAGERRSLPFPQGRSICICSFQMFVSPRNANLRRWRSLFGKSAHGWYYPERWKTFPNVCYKYSML